MKIKQVSYVQLQSSIELLKSNNLPVEDLSENVRLFVIGNANKVKGVAGIEHDRDFGLLRSLAVNPESRGAGLGKMLVGFIESFAKEHGIKELYLLTTTAERFFKGLGYKITVRDQVPDFIKETSEFKSVCPTSAAIMKKVL